MRNTINSRVYCLAVLLLVSKAVLSDEALDVTKAPVSIPLGGFKFAPVLEISETYNDNIFKRNALSKGSFVSQAHGGGQLSYEKNFNRYALTYAMQAMAFHESPADDYVDHYVGMNSHTEFTSRNRLNFDLKYLNSHFQRGTFLGQDISSPSIALGAAPNIYHQYGLTGAYEYGHKNAKGNLALNFNVDDYTFDNNQSQTARQDRTQYLVTPGFYYRVTPNSQLLAEVENKWVQLKSMQYSMYDNNKQRFLVGGTWAYSTKTNAKARIGWVRQRYDNPALQSFDDVTWDLTVKWLPKAYSQVGLTIAHDPTASLGSANIRASDRFKLGWKHHWTPRINSELTGSFENAYNTTLHRKDDFSSLGVEMNYGVQRWLGVGVSYTYSGLQSTNQAYIYDQDLFMVYLTGNPRISDEVRTPWASWY